MGHGVIVCGRVCGCGGMVFVFVCLFVIGMIELHNLCGAPKVGPVHQFNTDVAGVLVVVHVVVYACSCVRVYVYRALVVCKCVRSHVRLIVCRCD